jgi:23S rRNA pseudouridine1911/1915/1917 synthase
MQAKVYHVRQRNVGQTLAQMLRSIYAGRSPSTVQQLIRSRHVQVNGNVCLEEGRRLRADDVVHIFDEAQSKPLEAEALNVRFQDEHLLVVEKPPGITVQRHAEEEHWDDKRKDRQPTLEEMLQALADRNGFSKLPGRGAGGARPAIKDRRQLAARVRHKQQRIRVRAVHRLDRDTSGLMLFALSGPAEQALVRLFASHAIGRAYLAVVHGLIESRTIVSDLVRDRGDGLRGSLPTGQTRDDAKHAVTHVKLIRHIKEAYSLIDCHLETGRTHQIRIHLAEAGHVLCGERVYTRPTPGSQPLADKSGAPRQALHAHRLAFTHPMTDKPHTFESKLPRDLQRFLNRLEEPPAEDMPGRDRDA